MRRFIPVGIDTSAEDPRGFEKHSDMEEDKRIALLKMGYFPVTDDFWAGAGMPRCIGKGWDWAFRMPLSKQPFMPYKEDVLLARTIEESRMYATKNLLASY